MSQNYEKNNKKYMTKNLLMLATAILIATFATAGTPKGNNDKTMTYGSHTYTVSGNINGKTLDSIASSILSNGYKGKATAKVSFTNIPSDYEEFEAVYTQLLGKSIHGTAAMIPMAMEIYARDREQGEQCFRLICNSSSTVSQILRILKDKFGPQSQYAPENDTYGQRYLPAALLKGATAQNGYTPTLPYTVEMTASVNKSQETTYGTDYFVYILSKGWDTEQRSVEILLPYEGGLYKVFNCPSVYTQCKNIRGKWNGLQ